MISLRECSDTKVIDFLNLESYEDFDRIISSLLGNFNIKIIEKIEGLESRVWIFKMDEYFFSLHNNPYGNYLKPRDKKSEVMMSLAFIKKLENIF